MSHSNKESLHFYKYLNQKIGSVEVVRARRLSFIFSDLACSEKETYIMTIGSRGEGLDVKGSDLDLMYISSLFVVYEPGKNDVKDQRLQFFMDIEDTSPCFTHLRLNTMFDNLSYFVQQMIQQHRGENFISSELYKSQLLKENIDFLSMLNNIHGPCLTDCSGKGDLAFCLKCDQWVTQAKSWISRPRSTWPPPGLISKITSYGVLFVPIGNKGSITEHLQWRISFSVAEKILIYSFSHTQLLCYALLKILVKEIIDKNQVVKGLLCSYFLKTLLFWISEETETSVWRPDNFIPCFMACLQRLIYCIEYSTLLHYFIPDNNLFYLRFNSKNQNTLINILKNSYQTGIQIFSASETIHDYRRFPCETTRSVCGNMTVMKTVMNQQDLYSPVSFMPTTNFIISCMLYTLLHHCKTELSRCILTLLISYEYQRIPLKLTHIDNPNNKQRYKIYKHNLSQLLVGVNSDAVSGWAILAFFFYCHKHYLKSKDIINYTLTKFTIESTLSKITLRHTQKLKRMSLSKTITNSNVLFAQNSLLSPAELNTDVMKYPIILQSLTFTHFIHFLCSYHLEDLESCIHCAKQLNAIVFDNQQLDHTKYAGELFVFDYILFGIVLQMLRVLGYGCDLLPSALFRQAADIDKFNITSAAFRLHHST
ncbi:uncharacterized protein LOC134689814 [Mytilus trossulus]|uniref:uncharacterized protein LOC134689814 n=1 Tax=Mytilus trossulus TaxID=6551 RepID=UPI003004DFA4